MSDADILSELRLTLHTNSLGSEVGKKDVSIASSHYKGAAVFSFKKVPLAIPKSFQSLNDRKNDGNTAPNLPS
jgi:hypothetical protein